MAQPKLLQNTLDQSSKLKNMSDERLGCQTKSFSGQILYGQCLAFRKLLFRTLCSSTLSSTQVVEYLVIFHLFSIIEVFEWYFMGSLHKNIQLMLEFLKALFLVLQFLLYIIDLPDNVCEIAIYADDTTVRYYASDLRQRLKLASELESDLRNTGDRGRKCLIDFNNGKTQLVSPI